MFVVIKLPAKSRSEYSIVMFPVMAAMIAVSTADARMINHGIYFVMGAFSLAVQLDWAGRSKNNT